MKVRCDSSLPAIYITLDEKSEAYTAIEEECELVVDPNGDLVALRVALRELASQNTDTSLKDAIRFCLREGWELEGLGGRAGIARLCKEFRPPKAGARRVPWSVDLTLDRHGSVVGVDLVMGGDTDGEVRISWLCRGPPE